MGLTKATVLLGLVALATCSSLLNYKGSNDHLFPLNSESVYEWKALVRAGTHYPASYASVFMLNGMLHIQHLANATHMQLSNLSFKVHNGLLDHKNLLKAKEIPVESMGDVLKDLENGFIMMHDGKGLATGIITEEHEKEFSRNMKKSIASIMQMDVDALTMKPHMPYAFGFDKHEPSLYGFGRMDYTIVNNGEHIEIRKMHTMNSSDHLYQFLISNMEPLPCDRNFEEAIMHDSHRKYTMVLGEHAGNDKVLLAKMIQAHGGIFYFPLHARSESQYISVNQTFELVNVTFSIPKPIEVKAPHEEEHLTFHVFDENSENPDLTQGRAHLPDMTKVMPMVEQMLSDIWDYFQHDHLHTKTPNTKQGQMANRVIRVLKIFRLEHLEELHNNLKQKTTHELEVFFHILPLIGSKHSTVMIKNLIKQKQVKDEVASEMLQHMPENVYLPTMELVQEMEELLDLQGDMSSSVKKLAALSFGSLVHKSVMHSHKMGKNPNIHLKNIDNIRKVEQIYEKYVAIAMKKIKESQDFQTKMIYMEVLFNMKLPSIVEHLMPILNNESEENHHLRVMALWVMAPAMAFTSDPNIATKIFWPILANREEDVELRATAYILIMRGKPNISQLTNMFFMMMTEPNQELYRLHFTYVHSLKESKEPCNQDFSLRLRQMMTFMQPPNHGLSSITFDDFKDPTFGFSGGLSTILFNANHTQTIALINSAQIFNVMTHDYSYYIKIRGLKNNIFDIPSLLIAAINPTVQTSDPHIEINIMKQQQIINSYFINKANIDTELNAIKEFAVKEKHSLTKQLLTIDFERFHKIFLPTDLGTLAVWEFLAPKVQKTDLLINKELTSDKKLLNLHVEGRQATWVHYRHGLSLYNPIADIWQGINRYNAFDLIVPFNFDMSMNMQQKSLQLSWKKSSDPTKDLAGIRSHVKQMVFVKDDHKSQILDKSSPGDNEWVIVGEVDPQPKPVTLMDEDDLNTGRKWQVQIYDTRGHVTNGSFKHLLETIGQPWTKNYNSMFSHMLMTQMHFMRYTLIMPKRGMHGFLVRVEPSHEHAVSNIDLSMRITDFDLATLHYTSPFKFNNRLTYSVKNKEESLKTWDVTSNFDFNQGHTVNSMKMFMTRIIPGQKDYKICIDGIKKWTLKGVSGHLNLAMSQNPEGKCTKDSTVIDVTMTGERSHQQNNNQENHIEYGACSFTVPYAVTRFFTLHCLAAKTSVRHYVYNVKTTNVPSEFKMTFSRIWDHIRSHFMSYYTFDDEHVEEVAENNLKIDVLYPMQVQEVDVKITTPHHIHKLTSVPSKDLRWMGLVPDTTMYSNMFMYFHDAGMVDHCIVKDDNILYNGEGVKEVTPNEWTLYFASNKNLSDIDENKQIFLKKVGENLLALKVVDDKHILEATMNDKKTMQITIDGQVFDSHQQFYHQDWIDFQMIDHGPMTGIAMMLPNLRSHVAYDGHLVMMVLPEIEDHQIAENDKRKCLLPK